MKNLKKFIATILATTLTFGCVSSMSTFAGATLRYTVGSSTGVCLNERQEFIKTFGTIVLGNEPLYSTDGFLSYYKHSFQKDKIWSLLVKKEKILVVDNGIEIDWPSNFSTLLIDAFERIITQFGVISDDDKFCLFNAGFEIPPEKGKMLVSIGVFLIIGAYILHNMQIEDFEDIFQDDVIFDDKVIFATWLHKKVMEASHKDTFGDFPNIRSSVS